MNRQSSGRSWY